MAASDWRRSLVRAVENRIPRSRFLRLLLLVFSCYALILVPYNSLTSTRPGFDDAYPRIQHFDLTSSSQWKDCDASQSTVNSSLLHDPQWQKVIEHVFIYSAFVTDKYAPTRTVEIIAVVEILDDRFVEGQACVCLFMGGNKEWVISEIRVINERRFDRHETKYGGVRFICDIPNQVVPTSVAVQCRSPAACAVVQLPLHQLPAQPPAKLSIAVCHSVLFGSVSVGRLIEWIEYYKLLGIGKFVFYQHDVPSDVQRVLEHYHTEGILDVYRWVIPGINMTYPDVHYYAQDAAVNDCSERTAYHWDYTLIVDLDEFLITHNGQPLSSLIHPDHDDCLSVRCTMMQPPPSPPSPPHFSLLLKHSMRQSYVFTAGHRSKTVCRGRRVLEAGIHFPHYLLPGVRFDVAPRVRTADPDTEAILFHMREEMVTYGRWWEWVSDERGLRYVEQVAVNTQRVMEKLAL